MYCTFKKEDIIDGLSKAIGIIPKSGSVSLRFLWIEAKDNSLRIMATDSTTEFTGNYIANTKKEGNIGVNARAFVDLIRKLPNGDVSLNYNEENRVLNVEQGRRSYKLATADPTWFKALDEFPEENAILWSSDLLQELIDKTYFCISDDDSSEQLACFYMKRMEQGVIDCCGLNGHQLAVISVTNDELAQLLPEKGLLLQKKYAGELRKWLDLKEVSINITDKKLFLRNANATETLSFVRSDYNYPNHQAFIDRLKTPSLSSLTVNRKEIMEALDRLLIFNSENEKSALFEFSGSELILSAHGHQLGSAKEYLKVDFSGDIEKIAFPTKNLLDILSHYTSEKITFTITGTETPCGISGEQDVQYTVIIMPIKMATVSIYAEEE